MTDTMIIPDGLPVLAHGGHQNWQEGACFMEYTALLAGEDFTDFPACVDYQLALIMQGFNDWMTEEGRRLLVPFLGRAIGLHAPFLGQSHITHKPLHNPIAASHLRERVITKLNRRFKIGLRFNGTQVDEESLAEWVQAAFHKGRVCTVSEPGRVAKALRWVEAVHVAYEEAMDELDFPRRSEPVCLLPLRELVTI